jgi:hypothetical protein
MIPRHTVLRTRARRAIPTRVRPHGCHLSRLIGNTEHKYPIDGKRQGKLLGLRTSYFTVLLCAKETNVCFTTARAEHGLKQGASAAPFLIHASAAFVYPDGVEFLPAS